MKKFNKVLSLIRPKMIIVLGDRYEITSAVLPSVIQNVPIVHLYGGSVTEGAIDEKIRHAITKFSNVHLVLHKNYFNRIIQLGEEKWRTKIVGLDYLRELKKQKIINKKLLYKNKFVNKQKNLFCNFSSCNFRNQKSF